MSKIKVAIVMAWYAPYRLPLFRGLAERGDIDLTVIFCSHAEFGTLPNREEQPFKAVFLNSRTLLKYRYRDVFSEINTIRYPLGLCSALRDAAPDVIVAYEFRAECILAACFSFLHGCAYITWSDTTASYDSRMGTVRKLIRRLLLSRSATLIGSSTETIDFLNKVYGFPMDRSHLSILSAHVDEFVKEGYNIRPESSADGIVRFIYVGRLIPLKGIDLLIRAFAVLKRELANVHLTIIGEGEEEELLRKLADQAGCFDHVTFKGYIANDHLAEEFFRHDVFVFPTRLDVFGLVVAEAVACGLPVICSSRAGAARDLVRDNGIIVDPEDTTVFAQALRKLAQDAGLRTLMKQACQPIMKKHNLAAAVHGFLEAVDSAVLRPVKGKSASV